MNTFLWLIICIPANAGLGIIVFAMMDDDGSLLAWWKSAPAPQGLAQFIAAELWPLFLVWELVLRAKGKR